MESKTILSLGMGVQSTALYLMSALGELPRIDCAIFSDLGKEKSGTYKSLEWILNWQSKNDGPPIHIATTKNLFKDLLNNVNSTGERFASIPAYTKDQNGKVGMLRRQCTNEYKIAVVDKFIRFNIYESQSRVRLPKTRVWKGVSFDEIDRINIPKEAWKISVYPFCGWESFHPGKAVKMTGGYKIATRASIIEWFTINGFPIPPKSSCVFCPFQSELSWYELKTNDPEDFEAACLVDEAIRDSSKKGINQPIYLHESCIPLREVEFTATAPDLWGGDCSGTCHN